MNLIHETPKQYPAPDLRGEQNNRNNEKWGIGRLVQFPVSYRYNGGVSIDGDWYPGVEVSPPIVPDGYELIGIGVGYNLNARPPLATRYLKPNRKTWLATLSQKQVRREINSIKKELKEIAANQPDLDPETDTIDEALESELIELEALVKE